MANLNPKGSTFFIHPVEIGIVIITSISGVICTKQLPFSVEFCGNIRSNFEISLTFCDLALLNTFQKRRVSSPAPVTIASPSGDTA